MDYQQLFDTYKENNLQGRYIHNGHIEPLLSQYKSHFKISVLGKSSLDRPIYNIVAGNGKTKVFIWSQMHGNESTTTKAIFDFLNFLKSIDPVAKAFLEGFTFSIIPVLNPDGAFAYTRENANGIDLNRDSVQLSQSESRILREVFEAFQPDYCYNMHDQRTIFGVGEDNPKSATVSFLAPSYNEEREINENRQKAINVIAAMNATLQKFIPGQVGRFDDSFNINCIGDMFQSLGVPTILFEAGHYPSDYLREVTRKYVFFALLSGFHAINENVIVVNKKSEYFNIPQNKIIFYDIIYKNVKINYENKEKITNFASQYKEVLFENSVIFRAFISEIGNLDNYKGHVEYDCNEGVFKHIDGSKTPEKGKIADFTIDVTQFKNGIKI